MKLELHSLVKKLLKVLPFNNRLVFFEGRPAFSDFCCQMRLLFFLLSTVLVPWPSRGQQNTLTVVIRNIRDDKGKVGAALYRSESEFMKQIWKSQSADARTGVMEFVFENLPAGTYAVSVLHDTNDNGSMDAGLMGIPREGFGFSNDARGNFGPPRFDKAKFVVSSSVQQIITMVYY